MIGLDDALIVLGLLAVGGLAGCSSPEERPEAKKKDDQDGNIEHTHPFDYSWVEKTEKHDCFFPEIYQKYSNQATHLRLHVFGVYKEDMSKGPYRGDVEYHKDMLNHKFASLGWQFEVSKFTLLRDDRIFAPPADFDLTAWAQEEVSKSTTLIDGAIAVFMIPSDAPVVSFGGYTSDIPAKTDGYILLGADVVVPSDPVSNQALPHELGHYLGLYHTFQPAFTEYKQIPYSNTIIGDPDPFPELAPKPDNSNCEETGDYICDTQPDFDPKIGICSVEVLECSEEAIKLECGKDKFGQEGFHPDPLNIMSYWHAPVAQQACWAPEHFSEEQKKVMTCVLQRMHPDLMHEESIESALPASLELSVGCKDKTKLLDFPSIQEAIDYVSVNPYNYGVGSIEVCEGTYQENVSIDGNGIHDLKVKAHQTPQGPESVQVIGSVEFKSFKITGIQDPVVSFSDIQFSSPSQADKVCFQSFGNGNKSLVMNSVSFENCSAGALRAGLTHLILNNVSVLNSQGNDGAIYLYSSNANILGGKIINDTGLPYTDYITNGAGAFFLNGTSVVEGKNVEFDGNNPADIAVMNLDPDLGVTTFNHTQNPQNFTCSNQSGTCDLN